MNEELQAIKYRLEQMEGVQLAHQLLLTAVGQEMRQANWTALLGIQALVDQSMDLLRTSAATDVTLFAFQKTIAELTQKLDESDPNA